jgi:hypothetical protein
MDRLNDDGKNHVVMNGTHVMVMVMEHRMSSYTINLQHQRIIDTKPSW